MALDILQRGTLADDLLQNESFLSLWDEIVEESGRDILRTDLDEKDKRDNIYLAFHGGRMFINKLVEYRNLRDTEIQARKQREAEEEDTENDLPITIDFDE